MFFILGFNINEDHQTIRRISLYDLERRVKLESFQQTLYETPLSLRKFCLYRDMYFYIDHNKFNELIKHLGYEKQLRIDYKKFLKDHELHEHLI